MRWTSASAARATIVRLPLEAVAHEHRITRPQTDPGDLGRQVLYPQDTLRRQ
ncbi:hypothetical protein OHU11_42195 (plasmid) [Streptomyces sp. NBC_00257]|uniref:hypothetical protein n=1 Tax=unclassified Streptomyces TaxID=2593676 RepID=UPI0022593E8F|nr:MULTISPECIES: hypothetical protein [unclassified Streptomyces]MCX5434792.1 hypothetical protein [Streptomyces sp. NBC_00062]